MTRVTPSVLSTVLWCALVGVVSAVAVRSGSETARAMQAVPSSPGRIAEMEHHFTQVVLVHEAVIRGDLPAVRQPTRLLANAEVPSGVPAEAVRYVEAIRLAGRRAVDSTTLAAAAAATASMVTQCGQCHRAVGVMPAPSLLARPDVGGLVGHMLEHQRAVDGMLQGLLGPSTAPWRLGAERLRAAPLRPGDLPSDPKLTEEVRRAEARVHEIADWAVAAEGATARAAVYADLLTTCGECHSLHRGLWGPRRGG